ncbi:MAG: hypothetical protein ACREID_01555, partial [Planctomycetota bacterium]
MTLRRNTVPVRRAFPSLLLLLALPARAGDPLPGDVAAAHPDGRWTVRKEDLYGYLVAYCANKPAARVVLPEYMKERLIQAEARARGLVATDKELEEWLADLDRSIREETGGTYSLEQKRKDEEMTLAALRRRSRTAILRERLARAIYCEKDPTRDKAQPVPEDSIAVCVDELFRKAPKE